VNATAPGPFDPIELPPLTCRLKMLANGYEPIPLSGKRPVQSDWPNILIDEEAVRSSATLGANTGMRTARAPVLDIDIRAKRFRALSKSLLASSLAVAVRSWFALAMHQSGQYRCARWRPSRR
jgi:hypothetical protein